MFLEYAGSVFIGVVSGIISSICYTIFLLTIKPRIKISNQICCEKKGNDKAIYRIKIVNRTFSMVTNLRYSLQYCQMHDDGISLMEEIKPRKSPIISIDKNNFKKDNTDYAIRISYDIDLNKFHLDDKSKLVFVFIAEHALSNTTTCIKKEYYKKDIQVGMFESDKSTKILVEHKTNP